MSYIPLPYAIMFNARVCWNEGDKLSLINSSIPTTHTSNKREISQREFSRETKMVGLKRP